MSDEDVNLKPSDIVKENKERANNTIFNKVSESLNVDAEHIVCHKKWRSPMTPHQCECIHKKLNTCFNEHIYKLYNSVAYKETWYENAREFIAIHDNIEFNIDTSNFSDQEILEINDYGMSLFAGDKCADIDEDEFDGPNDLSIDEWETIDDIIMYYYLKDINDR